MLLRHLILLCVIKSFLISLVSSDIRQDIVTRPGTYNAQETPTKGTSRPVTVKVKMPMMTRTRLTLVENGEQYIDIDISLTVFLTWSDPRLRFGELRQGDYIFATDKHNIWTPPLMLVVEGTGNLSFLFSSFRIYPNGTVESETMGHIYFKHLYKPELSRHTAIRLVCWNYTATELMLEWNEIMPLGAYVDKEFETGTCNVSSEEIPNRRGSGDHSCLEVHVTNKKHKPSSVLIVYIPGIIAVVISWMCFWIGAASTLANTAILCSCWLQLFIQKVSIVKDLTLMKSYLTLNNWLDVCISFVFASFFVVIITTYFHVISKPKVTRKAIIRRRMSRPTAEPEEEEESLIEDSETQANALCDHFHFLRICFNGLPSTADKINAICRVLFPLAFLIFVTVFFAA